MGSKDRFIYNFNFNLTKPTMPFGLEIHYKVFNFFFFEIAVYFQSNYLIACIAFFTSVLVCVDWKLYFKFGNVLNKITPTWVPFGDTFMASTKFWTVLRTFLKLFLPTLPDSSITMPMSKTLSQAKM